MIAAAAHGGWSPLVVLSATATVLGILTLVARLGRWIASVEDRLQQHQEDLSGLGKAVAALRERDDE